MPAIRPRIRTIKPEFFKHTGLLDLEKETGLPVRLAYVGIWCCADREGRFPWDARALKAEIFPHEEVDFSRVLDALTTRGFVKRYESGAEWFGYVPSFLKHQIINNRELASVLPEPDQDQRNLFVDASLTESDASSTRDRKEAVGTSSSRSQFLSPDLRKKGDWGETDWLRKFLLDQKSLAIDYDAIPAGVSLFDREYWDRVQVQTGGNLTAELVGRCFAAMGKHIADKRRKVTARGWRKFISDWIIRQVEWDAENGRKRNGKGGGRSEKIQSDRGKSSGGGTDYGAIARDKMRVVSE